MRRLLVGFLLVGLTSGPSPARAQDPATKADELYRRAQSLLLAGRLTEACTDFRASESLDSALGSILSVAYCDENEGKPATAWSKYVSVASRAHERGQADREQFAITRARALEPRVTHVHLSLSTPDARLTVDGAPAQLAGEATLLVGPGKHTIGVLVPGKLPWARDVTFAEARVLPDPSYDVVLVPALAPPSALTPLAAPDAGLDARARRAPTQRWLGLGVAGVGLVGIVVGAVFGVETLGISSTCPVKSNCPQHDIDQASTRGIVSDVAFGVGLAGLGAGAWLFFSAPSAKTTTAWRLSPASSMGGPGIALGRAW